MLGALGGYVWSDARDVLGPAKVTKTPDEVSCVREAQRITELAMDATRDTLHPGVRQTDLSGTFLRRIFELGATANAIDPIWQVMGPTRAENPGPATATWPTPHRPPTGSSVTATSSGWTQASPTTAMPRTTAGPG